MNTTTKSDWRFVCSANPTVLLARSNWNLECWLLWRKKIGETRETLEARQELNLGHIGGRQSLSPLRHLCSPNQKKKKTLFIVMCTLIYRALCVNLHEKKKLGFTEPCKALIAKVGVLHEAISYTCMSQKMFPLGFFIVCFS